MGANVNRMKVYAVTKSKATGEVVWTPAGQLATNRDGTMSVMLDVLPLDGRLQVTQEKPEKDQDLLPSELSAVERAIAPYLRLFMAAGVLVENQRQHLAKGYSVTPDPKVLEPLTAAVEAIQKPAKVPAFWPPAPSFEPLGKLLAQAFNDASARGLVQLSSTLGAAIEEAKKVAAADDARDIANGNAGKR